MKYTRIQDVMDNILKDTFYFWDKYGISKDIDTDPDRRVVELVDQKRLASDIFMSCAIDRITRHVKRLPIVYDLTDLQTDDGYGIIGELNTFHRTTLIKKALSKVLKMLTKAYPNLVIPVPYSMAYQDIEIKIEHEKTQFRANKPKILNDFCEKNKIKPTNHLQLPTEIDK